jgi:hypothetical protein
MIDLTGSFHSEERRRDMLREAVESRKVKALRSYAPNTSHLRIARDRRRPEPLLKQLLAAILGH